MSPVAGARVTALLGQLSDHAERYRRIHIAQSPKAWQIEGRRQIVDAWKAGDRRQSAALLADHLSGTPFDVLELLEPGYAPERLRQTLEDVGGRPQRRRR